MAHSIKSCVTLSFQIPFSLRHGYATVLGKMLTKDKFTQDSYDAEEWVRTATEGYSIQQFEEMKTDLEALLEDLNG